MKETSKLVLNSTVQRINERRWPARTDLSYSGSTGKLEKGTFHTVTGSYAQPCSDTFVEANLGK